MTLKVRTENLETGEVTEVETEPGADFGDNTMPHPLEIPNARNAAYRASEIQRDVETALRDASRELAEKERDYRKHLSLRIIQLRAGDEGAEPVAWTTCSDVARGEEKTADLRYFRDVAAGELEAVRQQAYRRGADRRDVDALLEWSMKRDLRVDTPPPEGQEKPIGSGKA